jgi:single-stranded DNA-binding protein
MSDTYVTITGNLTADPELKFTPNGAAVGQLPHRGHQPRP